MDNFIKEIGRSYIISSFLPAALFVPLAFLLFRDFSPRIFQLQINAINGYISGSWVVLFLLIAIIWVGFFLFSSVDWVVKLFEGYYFPEWFRNHFAKKIYENQSKHLKHNKKLFENLKDWKSSRKEVRKFRKLFSIKRRLSIKELQPKEIGVPLICNSDDLDNENNEDDDILKELFDQNIFLPTRLGNVLRASEIYPEQRYRMEGITIWPRLFNVLPSNYLRELEEKNNQMIFMLNSSFLSFGIALLSFFVGIVGLLFETYFNLLGQHLNFEVLPFYLRGYEHIAPVEYLGIALFFVLFGYFVYSVSINVVEDFAVFVRTGYDLFRFELLKSLNLPVPTSLHHEKKLWSLISEFFVVGEKYGIDPKMVAYYFANEYERDVTVNETKTNN